MARLITCGFEVGSPGTFTLIGENQGSITFSTTGGTPAISTTLPRSGLRCLTYTNNSAVTGFAVWTITGVVGRHYYARIAFRKTGNPAATGWLLRLLGAGLETFAGILLNTNGTLVFYGGSADTQMFTSHVINNDEWQVLETHIYAPAGGTGTVEHLLNGAVVASNVAITMPTVALSLFRAGWGTASSLGNVTIAVDDVIVNDDQGATENSWTGQTKIVFLRPVADTQRNAGWLDGGGGTTNLFSALDNAPPVGVAAPAAGTQVKNAVSTTTETVTMDIAAYSDPVASGGGGMALGDIVKFIEMMIVIGNSTTTQRNARLTVVSNPAVAEQSHNTPSGTAAAAWPTGWNVARSATVSNPAVTLTTKPSMRIRKNASSTDALYACMMGIYVEYEPLLKSKPRNLAQSYNAMRRAAHF